jgi:hypothetical protein
MIRIFDANDNIVYHNSEDTTQALKQGLDYCSEKKLTEHLVVVTDNENLANQVNAINPELKKALRLNQFDYFVIKYNKDSDNYIANKMADQIEDSLD